MQKSYRFLLSALILGAFLLSACSGAVPQQDDSSGGSAGTQSSEVVFTGTVQSMGGAQWLISGQSVEVDGSTAVDSSIQVGDIVRVEANVSQDGIVLALKIESSRPDDDSNDNDANSNDDNANANGDGGNMNDNINGADDNSNANANTNANSNDGMDDDSEIFGVVESITADSITIGGVTYTIASFTEFKDIISVGDQVKIHVIVNADGTLTIREIEKSTGGGDDNSNINGNSNDDDGPNGNSNNNNSNDDDDNSNSNSNDNDDDDDDDDNNNSNDNDD